MKSNKKSTNLMTMQMEKKRAGAKTLLGKDAILLHQPLFETPFPSQNFPFGKCSKMSLMDENSRNKRYTLHLVSNDKNSHPSLKIYQIVVAMELMHIFKDLYNCTLRCYHLVKKF